MKKLLQILLLIVNVVFALLLLGSTLAGVLPPSKCIISSLLSYGYFYFFLANVIFILVWLFFVRKECLVSIIAIAIRFTFIPLFFQTGGTSISELPEDTTNRQLKVMTWNVHQFYGPDENKEMINPNAHEFLRMLREYDPDIMSLQEYYVPPKVHIFDSMKAMGYKYSYWVKMSSKGIPYGVAFFSKFPISYVFNIDQSQKFYADIIMNEEIIRVVCVHLDSYQLDSIDHQGLSQVVHGTVDSNTHRTIKKFRETIINHEEEWRHELMPIITASSRPLILAGDFNDTPASYLYQQVKKYLNDSYIEQGHGFCPTYHGYFPNFRIDYIWHSSDIKVLSYDRIKSDVSDHYPVIVTLEI